VVDGTGLAAPRSETGAAEPVPAGNPDAHDLDALLNALLTSLVACFQPWAEATELESLLFGLRQLFSRLARLYLQRLPHLAAATRPLVSGEVPPDDLLSRHAVWLQLRALRALLREIDTLCKLLVGAGEALLTELDSDATAYAEGPFEDRSVISFARSAQLPADDPAPALQDGRLSEWQAAYRRLPPFALQFLNLPGLPCGPARLDAAFATLLEEAGAIFGEILPSLHPQAPGEELAPALFLIDLAQHLEQIGVAIDGIWELLAALEEAFLLDTLL
jgi:hypothetical protein